MAFLAVAILGLCVGWRSAARSSSVLAAATALWVFLLYSFLVPFGAPRYITPSLALMSILAADGVQWLATKASWRRTGVAVACAFLLAGVVSQRFVLNREAVQQTSDRVPYETAAQQLRAAGIKPPCAIIAPSVAYYVGCIAPWTGETMPELLANTPQGLKAWKPIFLRDLDTIVYLAGK